MMSIRRQDWESTVYWLYKVRWSAEPTKAKTFQPTMARISEGFQSDYLYRKWCRCHMDLSHFVPGGSSQPDNTIEHVSGLNLTAETFQSRYESLSKPVIISGEGVIEAWPARQTWTLKGMLAKVRRYCT